MAKNKLTKILLSPDKEIAKTNGPSGILSRLFRIILLDLGIGPPKFGALLNDYVMDARHKIPNNKSDQTSTRGNLTKEFARTQMTWKVFVKAMRFLQAKKIRVSVDITHRSNRTTVHFIDFDFDDRFDAEGFENQLEQDEGLEEIIPIDVFPEKGATTNEKLAQQSEPPFTPPYTNN